MTPEPSPLLLCLGERIHQQLLQRLQPLGYQFNLNLTTNYVLSLIPPGQHQYHYVVTIAVGRGWLGMSCNCVFCQCHGTICHRFWPSVTTQGWPALELARPDALQLADINAAELARHVQAWYRLHNPYDAQRRSQPCPHQ